jgi:hypothetical protein
LDPLDISPFIRINSNRLFLKKSKPQIQLQQGFQVYFAENIIKGATEPEKFCSQK